MKKRLGLTTGYSDAIAGLTVTLFIVPQGLAYAVLAGVPAYLGLWAAMAGLVGYAVLGTSRRVSTGPIALTSAVAAQGLAVFAQTQTSTYTTLLATTTALAGGLCACVGGFGLTRQIADIPRYVMEAFISAAALMIAVYQLPSLVGLHLERSAGSAQIIWAIATQPHAWHLPTVLMGTASIGLFFACKRAKRRLPVALVVVGSSAALSAWLPADAWHIARVGSIPSSWPPAVQLAALDISMWLQALQTACVLAAVTLVSGYAIASKLRQEKDPVLQPAQEALALGAANIAAGLLGTLPVAFGFSRSVVNAQAGAKTQKAAVWAALGVAATLLGLRQALAFIPNAALCALILCSVVPLINLRAGTSAVRQNTAQGAVFWLCFAATLGLGLIQGLCCGVAAHFVARRR